MCKAASHAQRQDGGGHMGKHYWTIFIAWTFAVVPLTILAVAFPVAIERSQPTISPGSFYSNDERVNVPLGSAVYSKIPSTQLTFIASLSSTLSTAVLPAIMALFSYTIANNIAHNSDAENRDRLPSPYQLELLINVVNGSLRTFWSFLKYTFGPKRRRVRVIPDLWLACCMFFVITLIAYDPPTFLVLTIADGRRMCITMTDAWLNFVASTVDLVARDVLPTGDPMYANFIPGRGLSAACLDLPPYSPEWTGFLPPHYDCLALSPLLGSHDETLSGHPDQAANKSAANTVLSTPEGWMIVPVDLPTDIDFDATTFGSQTECRTVTDLCSLTRTRINDLPVDSLRSPALLGAASYDCRQARAGLDLTGNFSELHDPDSPADHGFTIVEYSDSTMSKSMSPGNESRSLRGPTLWYATLLQVPSTFATNSEHLLNETIIKDSGGGNGNVSIAASGGLVGPNSSGGNLVSSILACATTLADVEYSMVNGSVRVSSWEPMNSTASYAFPTILRDIDAAGDADLQQGAQDSISHASKPEDIATAWASTYDQTILTQGIGMLVGRPPLRVTKTISTQVTRIPRAPFITLILLDLLYSTIGTCLMIIALVAVNKGRGVADVQARLSTLGVVAESFEDPAWNEGAKDIDMLFAERRGVPTKKIALK
ncbi:MAG: hypothetical protein Q9174_006264, partial [Haloplaca sp. 1 TL-2023]